MCRSGSGLGGLFLLPFLVRFLLRFAVGVDFTAGGGFTAVSGFMAFSGSMTAYLAAGLGLGFSVFGEITFDFFISELRGMLFTAFGGGIAMCRSGSGLRVLFLLPFLVRFLLRFVVFVDFTAGGGFTAVSGFTAFNGSMAAYLAAGLGLGFSVFGGITFGEGEVDRRNVGDAVVRGERCGGGWCIGGGLFMLKREAFAAL